MVNEVRTYLLNLRADPTPQPGEEFVPASYVPLTLPAGLRPARVALFGRNPTRQELNLQLARLLAFLHASPLATSVTASDDRITYSLTRPGGVGVGDVEAPVHNFVTAAAGFVGAEGLFRPQRSETEALWQRTWLGDGPAPLRAGAAALALAARTADVAAGVYDGR